MLYQGNNPILRIVDVAHIRWKGETFHVAPRKFSALAFRISGSAMIDQGGDTHCVNTNDILYLPQNMGYTARYTDTEMLAIHFVTLRDDRQVEVYPFRNGEQIYKYFLQAHALWQAKAPGYTVNALAQLYAILGTICEQETSVNLPPHFIQAVSFINGNYRNNALTVEMVCAHAGIGATTFRQLFHKHYQKTPTQYITDLRLEYARNLISGGMSIENAACESGFNDPKYFARVVKRAFGCTPKAFKTYGK